MPKIVENEDGSESTMYSEEELQAQRDAALEEYKANNPDKSEELTSLQTELAEKEEELKGLKDKDFNFSNLRKERDDLKEQIDNFPGVVDEKITNAKKEILEGVMKDYYNETINSLTGGDEDLKKKIEYQYKRLGDAAATKEEISKKMRDAYVLATGDSKGVQSDAFSSGGARNVKVKENSLTEDDKDLLRKMGKGHLAK